MNQATQNDGYPPVTVSGNGSIVPASTGGPSPDARDNPGTESYPNQGTGGTSSGGGGGSTGGSTAPAPPPVDWSSLLGIYGLPSDVQAKINAIFSNTSDVNQATALAMAYVRGTNWYAQTYPGIQEGIARGVVSNEADYRAYVNQLQILNHQYYNTDITSQQIADYLKAGYSVGHVGQLFQGHAYATANKNDLNYLTGAFGNGQLSDNDLETLGQETAGLDSAMGQKIQSLVQKATQRMQTVFSGTLATPSLSIGGSGLSSPSLAGQRQQADTGA